MQLPYYQFTQNKLHQLIQAQCNNRSDNHSELDSRPWPLLWAAADEGYMMLNLYWQKSDNHSGQGVAMILDPRMRLKVFENLYWELEWIDDGKKMFHRVYNDNYASKEPSLHNTSSEVELLKAQRIATAVRLPVPLDKPGTRGSTLARDEEAGFDDPIFDPLVSPTDQSQMRSLVDFYHEEECANHQAGPVQW